MRTHHRDSSRQLEDIVAMSITEYIMFNICILIYRVIFILILTGKNFENM